MERADKLAIKLVDPEQAVFVFPKGLLRVPGSQIQVFHPFEELRGNTYTKEIILVLAVPEAFPPSVYYLFYPFMTDRIGQDVTDQVHDYPSVYNFVYIQTDQFFQWFLVEFFYDIQALGYPL